MKCFAYSWPKRQCCGLHCREALVAMGGGDMGMVEEEGELAEGNSEEVK